MKSQNGIEDNTACFYRRNEVKSLYKKYIEELKNGKQIRIKYKEPNHDGCEEDGWWSEELWCYDNNLDLFKCYYPVSSYEKGFYSAFIQSDTECFLKESIRDFNNEYGDATVTDIIIEDCGIPNSLLSIREAAMEKIKTMSDEELKQRLLL